MAKFCTKCGKPLEEGKPCECSNVIKTTANNLFSECLEIVKSFLKKPIDTLEENVDDSKFNSSLIMIGINAIAVGLFVLVLVKELLGSMVGLMMGFSSYGSMIGLGTTAQMNIPYVKYFFIAFVVAIIVTLLIALCSYLLAEKVFKGNTTIKKMVTLFGFSSIISTVSLIAAAILSFVNITIGMLVYVAGSLLNTYYNYKGLEFACNVDRNKLGYVLMPSILAVSLVVGYLLPKIMM